MEDYEGIKGIVELYFGRYPNPIYVRRFLVSMGQ